MESILSFKPNRRFGPGFYLSEIPETTLAELKYHSSVGTNTIRYTFNQKTANILDLTKPKIAKEWGYMGGNDYSIPQAIASRAQEAGYRV